MKNLTKNRLEAIGITIKSRRKKKKMSQQSLADEANIHRNYVISLEKGRQNPSYMVLYNIAETLGYSLPTLIREIEKNITND